MSIITITKENFEAEVLCSERPVLLDFWAEWCGPCHAISPIIKEIDDAAVGIKTCKINIEEQPGLADRFGIMSIPTLLAIHGGQESNRLVGLSTKKQILNMFCNTDGGCN